MRREQAFQVRVTSARYHHEKRNIDLTTNGDEARYSNYIGSFTKTLPHNDLGEVDPNVYAAYLRAVNSGRTADFEAIPMGGKAKLANPQGAWTFDFMGADSHQVEIAAPPAFASAEAAGEMVENYWNALTRDVPFSAYGSDPVIAQAVRDLNTLGAFKGPKESSQVTANTIFRGPTKGDLNGPYVSQFLTLPIPYGATTVPQLYKTPVPGDDFMTTYADWLAIQRGTPASKAHTFDIAPRYIRNGRDLTNWVHSDFSYMGFLNAAQILLGFGAPALSASNPYLTSATQSGFVTFGGPAVLEMVAFAANASFRSTWCQKWMVHRRVRPEAFGGRVHNNLTNGAKYPIHGDLMNSQALQAVYTAKKSYLLPMAYPEGSPAHPSFPAGHAAAAGACVTMLKAFFNESFVFPAPMVAADDGASLKSYTGSNLTVGDELNKLTANIALSRNTAGVHYRSDGIQGILLGEAVALGLLHDLATTFNERFDGFTLTRFDGTKVTICPEC